MAELFNKLNKEYFFPKNIRNLTSNEKVEIFFLILGITSIFTSFLLCLPLALLIGYQASTNIEKNYKSNYIFFGIIILTLSIGNFYTYFDPYLKYTDLYHYYDNYTFAFNNFKPQLNYGQGREVLLPLFNLVLTYLYPSKLNPSSYCLLIFLFSNILIQFSYRFSSIYRVFGNYGSLIILILPFYGMGLHLIRTYLGFTFLVCGILLSTSRKLPKVKFFLFLVLASLAHQTTFLILLVYYLFIFTISTIKFISKRFVQKKIIILLFISIIFNILFDFILKFRDIITYLAETALEGEGVLFADKLYGYNSYRLEGAIVSDFKSILFSYIPLVFFISLILVDKLFLKNKKLSSINSNLIFLEPSKNILIFYSLLVISMQTLYIVSPIMLISLRVLAPFLINNGFLILLFILSNKKLRILFSDQNNNVKIMNLINIKYFLFIISILICYRNAFSNDGFELYDQEIIYNKFNNIISLISIF